MNRGSIKFQYFSILVGTGQNVNNSNNDITNLNNGVISPILFIVRGNFGNIFYTCVNIFEMCGVISSCARQSAGNFVNNIRCESEILKWKFYSLVLSNLFKLEQ